MHIQYNNQLRPRFLRGFLFLQTVLNIWMILKNQNMFGVILAVTGFLCYAIGDVGFKYAGQHINTYQIAFYAQFVGLLVLLLYAFIARKSLKTKKIKLHVIRAICIAIPYYVAVYAFQHKSLAECYIFFYMSPFFTGILAALILKEAFSKHQIIAVIMGFIGVCTILRPGFISIDWIAIAIIFSSLCYSYASVITRRDGEGESELVFSFYVMFGIFLLSIIPFTLNPIIPEKSLYLSLGVAGSFEAIATGLIALASVKTRAVTVQKLGYTGLLWVFLFGWIFFNDVLVDTWTFIGATIIISSGLYMIYREHQFSRKTKNK